MVQRHSRSIQKPPTTNLSSFFPLQPPSLYMNSGGSNLLPFLPPSLPTYVPIYIPTNTEDGSRAFQANTKTFNKPFLLSQPPSLWTAVVTTCFPFKEDCLNSNFNVSRCQQHLNEAADLAKNLLEQMHQDNVTHVIFLGFHHVKVKAVLLLKGGREGGEEVVGPQPIADVSNFLSLLCTDSTEFYASCWLWVRPNAKCVCYCRTRLSYGGS